MKWGIVAISARVLKWQFYREQSITEGKRWGSSIGAKINNQTCIEGSLVEVNNQ